MKIQRTKSDLLATVVAQHREIVDLTYKIKGTDEQNDKLSAQVRNLTTEKSLWESRASNARRAIGELRRQRSETLQALARVLAGLAATPEAFDNPRPSPSKDEAPF